MRRQHTIIDASVEMGCDSSVGLRYQEPVMGQLYSANSGIGTNVMFGHKRICNANLGTLM